MVTYLDPQPNDRILDVGCGDGTLTVALAQQCKFVVGLDSSAAMIIAAQDLSGQKSLDNCVFEVVDCAHLSDVLSKNDSKHYGPGQFDKVFSNAAYHWILRDPSRRDTVFPSAFQALRSGGTFVFECGGAGNVAEVVIALIAALVDVAQLDIEEAKQLIPWYFASEAWASEKLEQAGFQVSLVELEYRPTKLSADEGIEGWIRLFGASILNSFGKEVGDRVVQRVCDLLQWAIKQEDGSQYVGYVRLRAIAKKP